MADTFKTIFKRLNKGVNTASQRAANRAINSTRAKYAKDVSSSLGLTSKRVRARSKIFKANKNSSDATLSITTKVLIAAHLFKPKVEKVNSARGPRRGASYEVKGRSRTLTVKGFIAQGKGSNGKVILQRVRAERYPLEIVRIDAFKTEVEGAKPSLISHLRNTFDKNFKSELNFELSKKK